MKPDVPVASQEKRLLHDLWIIWIVQLSAVVAGYAFLFVYSQNLVPNYPEWDAFHIMCGIFSLACMVTFVITMLWGGYKIMDVEFMPKIVRGYAASLYLVPFLILFIPSIDIRLAKVAGFLFFAFPFYSILPLFFICLWLRRHLMRNPEDNRIYS
ncbi:MAG: hypothetical protein FWC50_07165 [Planctomycetaceae bacterium]|nr:hypothetical protein [Planctomycetaceae bacterium]